MEIIDMKDIAIYGAGGLGREIACLLRKINEQGETWNLIGFFDDGKPIGTLNEYGRVLGGIHELNTWDIELNVIIAIGNPRAIKQVTGTITNPLDRISKYNLWIFLQRTRIIYPWVKEILLLVVHIFHVMFMLVILIFLMEGMYWDTM